MRTRCQVITQRKDRVRLILRTLGVVSVMVLWVASFAQGQPVVGMSFEPTLASEADGDTVALAFTVDGEIPPPVFDEEGNLVSGGLPILF